LFRTLKDHSQGDPSVTFGRNGQILVSGSRDRTIKIWRVAPYYPAPARSEG